MTISHLLRLVSWNIIWTLKVRLRSFISNIINRSWEPNRSGVKFSRASVLKKILQLNYPSLLPTRIAPNCITSPVHNVSKRAATPVLRVVMSHLHWNHFGVIIKNSSFISPIIKPDESESLGENGLGICILISNPNKSWTYGSLRISYLDFFFFSRRVYEDNMEELKINPPVVV